MFGFIVGTSFYDYPGLEEKKIITDFGEVTLLLWDIHATPVAILPRHGKNHEYLPHHINYKACIQALKNVGVTKIVSFSVAGVLNTDYKLAEPYLVDDLLFLENRLPNGEICSFFDTAWKPGRGHLIAGSFYNSQIMSDIQDILGSSVIDTACYAYAVWPRFNSKWEIRMYRNCGWDLVSQTCGPEIILANELEIPIAQVCFAVDYANGVMETNTSMEELGENIAKSREVFQKIIESLSKKNNDYSFEGFVYRFD